MARARSRRPRGRPLRPAGGHTGRGASRLDALHVNDRRQSTIDNRQSPKRFLPSNSQEIGFASRREFCRKFWRWGPRTAVRANKKNRRAVEVAGQRGGDRSVRGRGDLRARLAATGSRPAGPESPLENVSNQPTRFTSYGQDVHVCPVGAVE